MSDIQVQRTNDSSVLSKVSASNLHYIDDDFLKHFVTKTNHTRSPLINRGYYIRVKAINTQVITFLKTHFHSQVISLGAGFDTLYFRLFDHFTSSKSRVFEVDFPAVIERKRYLIHDNQELNTMLSLPSKSVSENVIRHGNYSLIGCDITQTARLAELLSICEIEYDAPTLILSECVMTYIDPDKVDIIIQWISSSFRNVLLCTYEQILPNDGFGKVMSKHFMSLGSPLKNVNMYPSKVAQTQRYLNQGFASVDVFDMNEFYQCLPVAEKLRVDMLEPFDEFEDFYQKCNHYTLVLAAKGTCKGSLPNLPVTSIIPESNTCNAVTFNTSSAPIQRFGHSSVCLPNGSIVIIGGFGISELSNTHRRLNDVLLFHKNDDHYECNVLAMSGDVPAGLVYHKAVVLDDGKILVTGGRQSPYHPQTEYLYVSIEKRNQCNWTTVPLKFLADTQLQRWRHTANTMIVQGHECVLIAGGCSTSNSVLDDIILIQATEWKCTKVPVVLPQGTHSHSAVVYNNTIIIIGGLTEEMVPLSTCCQIKYEEHGWMLTEVTMSPLLTPRFSGGTCIHKNTIVIVGGVGKMEGAEILTFNLETDSSLKYKIEVKSDGAPVIFHSFTVHACNDGHLWLFGGGGNCFSFGTHFNISPIQISLL